MITHLSQEEIKQSYEALDVSRLALDLLQLVQEAPNNEEAVNKCLSDYHQMLEDNQPDWHLCVDPLSIYSLTQHCMELLAEGELPDDLLSNNLFEARNQIFSKAVLPFISVLADVFHEVLQDAPALTEWKQKSILGRHPEHDKFYAIHPDLSARGKMLCGLREELLQSRLDERNVITALLSEEAMGMIDPEFVRTRFIELNEILDVEIKKNCDKPLADRLFAHIPGFMDGEG